MVCKTGHGSMRMLKECVKEESTSLNTREHESFLFSQGRSRERSCNTPSWRPGRWRRWAARPPLALERAVFYLDRKAGLISALQGWIQTHTHVCVNPCVSWQSWQQTGEHLTLTLKWKIHRREEEGGFPFIVSAWNKNSPSFLQLKGGNPKRIDLLMTFNQQCLYFLCHGAKHESLTLLPGGSRQIYELQLFYRCC